MQKTLRPTHLGEVSTGEKESIVQRRGMVGHLGRLGSEREDKQ